MRVKSPYDDMYATCSRTHATLRVFLVDPDSVTRALGLEPSRIQRKGEPWKTRRGWSRTRARHHAWFLTSEKQVCSRDCRRHVDWLLDRVEPVREVLEFLQREGAEIDVACFWESAVGHGGPTLSAAAMRRLGEFGIPLWFDIYYSSVADPDPDDYPVTH